MESKTLQIRQTRILPGLRRIQQKHGYLQRGDLENLAAELEIPLYRIEEVASFFPHFNKLPPEPVTLHICRDMSCHLAGSGRILAELGKLNEQGKVRVKGVSCIGRCDRSPAACLTLRDDAAPRNAIKAGEAEDDGELLFLGRNAEQLEKIVKCYQNQTGKKPSPNQDAELPDQSAMWKIDPYSGGAAPEYAAVKKAIAARDASLQKAVEYLETQPGWPSGGCDLFRMAARETLGNEFSDDSPVAAAVLAWRTADGWAKELELGGWSELLLQEFEKGKEKKGADLRGMGGAGIPAAQKWRDVRDNVRTARTRGADDRAFIVVNGDESEPGTFKDRELLLRVPHLVVEGVILAGLITDATQGFIYIRHEYGEQIEACRQAIRRAEELGLCGLEASALGRAFPVSVFVSPGGYICGEQSALIEAMSDRRGEPRNMPPKLESNGLDDRPTLVSNVETFAWAPYVWLNGGASYASLGVNECRGQRFFSVSGDVKRPGVYEAPMGLSLRELIYGDQYCQGIQGDRKLKAFAPSGPSGGFLPPRLEINKERWKDSDREGWERFARRHGVDPAAGEIDLLDMELELNVFRAYSPTAALGAGLVVYAEGRDMAEQAVNANEFFRNESCGKCVPCRIGSQKFAALGANLLDKGIDRAQWDLELRPLLAELGKVMEFTSICGLGRSVPQPLRTVAEFFEADIDRHLVAHVGAPRKHV